MLRIQSHQSTESGSLSELSVEDLTQSANRLLQENNLGEAYPYLAQLARVNGDNPEVQLTAGLVAVKLDRPAEARDHFKRAVDSDPNDFNANYNLALVEVLLNQTREALARLRHLRRLHPDNSALLNDMAVIWSDNQRPGRALGAFSRALKINPNDSLTRNNAMKFCLDQNLLEPGRRILTQQQQTKGLTDLSKAEIHRWQEIIGSAAETTASETIPKIELSERKQLMDRKIAFFASQQTFLTDIMKELSLHNEVRVFQGQSLDDMRDMMAWADLAWFEWCDQHIIAATQLPSTCKVVCRLHSYEAFTDMPAKVNWDKVDHLLFVNESVREIFRQQVKTPVVTSVIHNGLDLSKYPLPVDKPLTKKIASVGYINYKKNPALLLYCFKKLHQHDPGFTLHVAGTHQDPRLKLYFDHFLSKNPLPVYFDGWVEDMPSWYADKSFVVSTSLFESFHYSIAEGMACGLIPLIHNWYGAGDLYPHGFLFNDPDDFVELMLRVQGGDVNRVRETNRQFIADHYALEDKTAEISVLLAGLFDETATNQSHGIQL